jgi:hypothetical protein
LSQSVYKYQHAPFRRTAGDDFKQLTLYETIASRHVDVARPPKRWETRLGPPRCSCQWTGPEPRFPLHNSTSARPPVANFEMSLHSMLRDSYSASAIVDCDTSSIFPDVTHSLGTALTSPCSNSMQQAPSQLQQSQPQDMVLRFRSMQT